MCCLSLLLLSSQFPHIISLSWNGSSRVVSTWLKGMFRSNVKEVVKERKILCRKVLSHNRCQRFSKSFTKLCSHRKYLFCLIFLCWVDHAWWGWWNPLNRAAAAATCFCLFQFNVMARTSKTRLTSGTDHLFSWLFFFLFSVSVFEGNMEAVWPWMINLDIFCFSLSPVKVNDWYVKRLWRDGRPNPTLLLLTSY